jgi:hypothetical protein
MITRQQIVDEARSWIGTPFHHQAYRKGVGSDCIGMIAGVGLHFNLPGMVEWDRRSSSHNYAEQPDPRYLLSVCDEFLDRVPKAAIELADILLLRFETDPMHFSLVTKRDPLYVIHSLSRLGRVAEHRIDDAWGGRVMRAYRLRGVE